MNIKEGSRPVGTIKKYNDRQRTAYWKNARNQRNKKLPLYLKDAIPFGKYKGKKLSEILRDDPNYINWINDKTRYSVRFSV